MGSDKERNDFIDASVLIYGLPYKVPDDTIASTLVAAARGHKLQTRLLDEEYVRDLFPVATYGEIGVVRVVPVKQAPNENGDYSGPNNNSWALLKFEQATNAEDLVNRIKDGEALE